MDRFYSTRRLRSCHYGFSLTSSSGKIGKKLRFPDVRAPIPFHADRGGRRDGARNDLLYFAFGVNRANPAPCGSVRIDIVPTLSIAIGGTATWPPNCFAFSVDAAVSVT